MKGVWPVLLFFVSVLSSHIIGSQIMKKKGFYEVRGNVSTHGELDVLENLEVGTVASVGDSISSLRQELEKQNLTIMLQDELVELLKSKTIVQEEILAEQNATTVLYKQGLKEQEEMILGLERDIKEQNVTIHDQSETVNTLEKDVESMTKWAKARNDYTFFQTIQTDRAYAVCSFVIDGVVYAAFGSLITASPATSVWKWNGTQFVLHQELASISVMQVLPFVIDGVTFLAISNYYTSIGIFEWVDDAFVEFQNIPLLYTRATDHVFIDGTHYYIAASYDDSICHVYKWNGTTFDSDVYQQFAVPSPLFLQSVEIDNDLYLSFTGNIATHSDIYKWNGTQFEVYQEISTSIGAHGQDIFAIDEDIYLAIAQSCNVAPIFKWNGTHFEWFQELSTKWALTWKHFSVNGLHFLIVGNWESPPFSSSVIYKWDGVQFVYFQSMPAQGTSWWESIEIDGINYLLAANYVTEQAQASNVFWNEIDL